MRERKKGIFWRRGHFCARRPYEMCSNRVFTHIDQFFWVLQVKKSEVKTSSKFSRIMDFSAPKTGSKKWFSENREKSLKKVISTTCVPIFSFITPNEDSNQAKHFFRLWRKTYVCVSRFACECDQNLAFLANFCLFLTPPNWNFRSKRNKSRIAM